MKSLRVWMVLVLVLSVSLGAVACASEDTPSTETDTPVESPSNDDAQDSDAEPAGDADSDADADADAGDTEEVDPARLVVETKCSLCHTLDRVWGATYDRAGWEATVDRMKANGLVISDDEYETVVDYLTSQ